MQYTILKTFKTIILIVQFMLPVFSMGCDGGDNSSGPRVIINKKDDGKEITVKVGDIIRIELEQYSGTGYTWVLDRSREDILEFIGQDTNAISRAGFVGSPVTRIWKLRALRGGETEINLYLYRPWEGKDRAVDAFKVRVKIF